MLRITNEGLRQAALSNLQSTARMLATDSQQISSQHRLNRPSDDPTDVHTAMTVRDGLDQIASFTRNITAGRRTTDATDTALSGAESLMARVNELITQAGNDTLSASDRASIADELDSIQRSLVGLANTRVGDNYIFAGQAIKTQPYAEPPANSATVGAYAGDNGALTARVAPGQTVQTNVPGSTVFNSVFAAIGAAYTEIKAGQAPSTATRSALDTANNDVATAHGLIGARTNRLDQASEVYSNLTFTHQAELSALEDVDLSAAISAFSAHQASYQAALAVNAKIIMPSLLDYLK